MTLTAGLAHLKLASWSGVSLQRRTELGRGWARRVSRGLGLRVLVRGRAPGRPVVLVANHRSYADILAVLGSVDCVFLAKAEIGRWPIIGALAHALDTVLVDRDCKESRRGSRRRLAALAEGGNCVALFPEGTTSRGPGVLDFQPGIFWSAARRGLPVVPVALHYESEKDAWVDDDTLLGHFLDRFSRRHVSVRLEFGPVLECNDGEALRREAQDWVSNALDRQRFEPLVHATHSSWEGDRDGDRSFVPGRFPLPAEPVTGGR